MQFRFHQAGITEILLKIVPAHQAHRLRRMRLGGVQAGGGRPRNSIASTLYSARYCGRVAQVLRYRTMPFYN